MFDLPYPVSFEHCEFTDPPDLRGATLHSLALIDCVLPGLIANGLRVRRDLNLSGSVIAGAHRTWASTSYRAAVWLCEAEIGGRLIAVGTRIDGRGERAIQADRLAVGGAVRLIEGFEALGEVRLLGVRVGGSLEVSGAKIHGPDGWALTLAAAQVSGNLYLTGTEQHESLFDGLIDLGSARVAGDLLVHRTTVNAPVRLTTRGSYAAAEQGRPRAIRASRLVAEADVRFSESAVNGELHLSSARLGGLDIVADCRLRNRGGSALDLSNAEIRSIARLGQGLAVEGRVRMPRARIGSRLVMRGVRLSHPQDGVLLDAYGLSVNGVLEAGGLEARGGRLVLDDLECQLIDLRGARLGSDQEVTLSMTGARVHGNIALSEGFSCRGRVTVNSVQADGWLDCEKGTFAGPDPAGAGETGLALSAITSRFAGGIDLTWDACSPGIDLTSAATSILMHETDRWPGYYAVSGLTYDRLDSGHAGGNDPWDARRICRWLDGAEFDAGVYEQAARVFRQHGQSGAAETILIRQRDAARRAALGRNPSGGVVTRVRESARRSLDWGFGRAVGYGYRPGRALIALIALLVAVFALLSVSATADTLRAADPQGDVYGVHGLLSGASPEGGRGACGHGEVRCFNRLFYAVDTVVPLVDLKQRETWYPDSGARWGRVAEYALDLATLLGWLLSSIVVLSFARLARTT